MNNKLTLLYVEDDIEILNNVTFLLENDFNKIYTAQDGEEALKLYYKYKPNIILSDINIPKINGLVLMEKIREDDANIPIVLITAHNENEILLNAIEIGVSAFIIKPFKMEALTSAINKAIDKKYTNDLAIHDSLTSLYDRTIFDKTIKKMIDTAKRYDTFFSYIMLDIDHFKVYNDTYGHVAGDKALKDISKVFIKHTNRDNDYAFRVGGEEFSLIILGLDKEKSITLADTIKEDILALKIEHKNSPTYQYMSISIGLYSSKGDSIDNVNNILIDSDKALYLSKNSGRNKITTTD